MYTDILTRIMDVQARIADLCWYCGKLGDMYDADTLYCASCWLARFGTQESTNRNLRDTKERATTMNTMFADVAEEERI